MAYDEELVARVRNVLVERGGLSEQRDSGGVRFLLGGNMCCGVRRNDLLVRLSPTDSAEALGHPDVRPMEKAGKPVKGWLYVSADGVGNERALGRWIERAADFTASLPEKIRSGT